MAPRKAKKSDNAIENRKALEEKMDEFSKLVRKVHTKISRDWTTVQEDLKKTEKHHRQIKKIQRKCEEADARIHLLTSFKEDKKATIERLKKEHPDIAAEMAKPKKKTGQTVREIYD